MRSIIVLFLTFCFTVTVFSQKITSISSFTSRSVNFPLELRIHKDSIKGLLEISSNGKVFINKDSVDLKLDFPYFVNSFNSFYEPYLKDYYMEAGRANDDFCIILTFCFDYLISFSILTKGYENLTKLKMELRHRFPQKKIAMYASGKIDSTGSIPGRMITYDEHFTALNWSYKNSKITLTYYEDIIKQLGIVSISDKKVYSKMPHWCGTCNKKRNTWDRLEKYIKNTQ